MTRADELRAELEVVELEDQLKAAKENGDEYYDLKHQLRDARRAHRETRATAPVAEGDAVANPDVIATSAEVQEG